MRLWVSQSSSGAHRQRNVSTELEHSGEPAYKRSCSTCQQGKLSEKKHLHVPPSRRWEMEQPWCYVVHLGDLLLPICTYWQSWVSDDVAILRQEELHPRLGKPKLESEATTKPSQAVIREAATSTITITLPEIATHRDAKCRRAPQSRETYPQ